MLSKFTIPDFSGGINLVDLDGNKKPGEAYFGLNTTGTFDVELWGRGEIRPRRGYDMFSVTLSSLPSTGLSHDERRITNMKGFRKTGTDSEHVFMSNADGIMQWLDPNTSSNQLVTVRAADASAEWEWIQAQRSTSVEFLWLLNGVSTPQKYDINGNTLTNWTATTGAVPNGRMLRVWKNMMIVAGVATQPQRLYFSNINDPEAWPATNFIDIKSTDDESDKVTALEVIGENLLVFKERSLWVVFDSITFDNRRVGDVGCVGYKAVCRSKGEKDERVYFVSRNGVYSTDGDEIREESKKIRPVFTGESGTWTSTVSGGQLWTFRDKTSLTMTWDGKMFLINWQVFGINATTNSVWYMDTRFADGEGNHPWFRHKNSASYISALCTLSYTMHSASNSLTNGNIAVFDRNSPGGGAQEVGDYLRTDRTSQDDPGGDSFPIEGMWQSGQWTVTEGIEPLERIRRTAVYGGGGGPVAVSVENEQMTGSPGLQSAGSFTFVTNGVLRTRPEVRGRVFRTLLWMQCTSGQPRVQALEYEFRGGREH